MSRLLSFIAMLALALLLVGGVAQAHVLEADGDIGAVLHILPDDSPSSGIPTTYELAFEDTSGRLRLSECNCTVTVRGSDQVVRSSLLNVAGRLGSSNSVTFPRADIYTIEVEGKPKQADSFQPFKLSYIVRVNAGNQRIGSVPPLLWVGISGLIGLVILAAYAMEVSYTAKYDNDNVQGIETQ